MEKSEASDFLKKQPQATTKPDDVAIKDFKPIVVTGRVPGVSTIIVMGLGDDNKLYQWDSKHLKWMIG